MSFESDFYRSMTVYSALVLLIDDRLYPDEAPRGVALPYVVYSRENTFPVSGLDGFASGLERIDCAVECYAAGWDEAVAIAEKVCDAVDAQKGDNNIRGRCAGELDVFETDARIFQVSLTLALFHRS